MIKMIGIMDNICDTNPSQQKISKLPMRHEFYPLSICLSHKANHPAIFPMIIR